MARPIFRYCSIIAALPVLTGQDNPVLRAKTKKVPAITKDVLKLLRDMEDTVIEAKGAGIAAPQVGKSDRVCIAVIQQKMIALINPEITWRSEEKDVMEEGCLSLPNVWLNIERPTSIQMNYMDTNGKTIELKLQDFDARVVQHEVDHLEGILIVDHQRDA